MIGTDFQKHTLTLRRDHRDMAKAGWEFVGEGGGDLWELYRGRRIGWVITDVRIAKDGRGLWVKTEDRVARILSASAQNERHLSADNDRHDRTDHIADELKPA